MKLPTDRTNQNAKQLIEQAKSTSLDESQAAIATIYECYEMDVWRFVRSKVNNDTVADDIAMDTWFYMVDNIHSFEWKAGEGNKLKAWLFNIAHYKKLEYFRADQAHYSFDELTDTQLKASQYINKRLSSFDRPIEDEVLNEEVTSDVQNEADRIIETAINTLPDLQQQIILLIYFNNVQTVAEVANILDFPPGKKGESKVRVYHSRAKKNLKKNTNWSDFLGK